jgi:hypothetical protein
MNKEKMGYPIYSQEHFDFIKNNYLTMSQREMGIKLGVSHDIIRNQLLKLGLKKPKPFIIRPKDSRVSVSITPELHEYLHKRKKYFDVDSLDKVIRKIVKEWIAFKRIERERKSTTNNNINTQAHE